MKTNEINGQIIRPLWQIRVIDFFDFKFKMKCFNSKRLAKKYANQFESFLIKTIKNEETTDFYRDVAKSHIEQNKENLRKTLKVFDDLEWKHSNGLM